MLYEWDKFQSTSKMEPQSCAEQLAKGRKAVVEETFAHLCAAQVFSLRF